MTHTDHTAPAPAPAAQEPPAPVTRYFTFGYGHTDPRTGASLAERYITVTAPDAEQCHAVMLALFGRGWAFAYDRLPPLPAYAAPVTEYGRVCIGAGLDQEEPPDDDPDHPRLPGGGFACRRWGCSHQPLYAASDPEPTPER